MNRVWGGESERVEWECAKCGRRKLWAPPKGYLPPHRPPKKRVRCNGSGASVQFHKKV